MDQEIKVITTFNIKIDSNNKKLTWHKETFHFLTFFWNNTSKKNPVCSVFNKNNDK